MSFPATTVESDDTTTGDATMIATLSHTQPTCSVRDTMTTTPTPTDRVAAVKAMGGLPSQLRAASLDLLAVLSEERRALLSKQKTILATIGKHSHAAAQRGLSYEKQADRTGIDRNSIYRAAGQVELGCVDPKPGEINNLVGKLKRLSRQRDEINASIEGNSKALSELVCWLYYEIGVNRGVIAHTSGLYRSTINSWITAGAATYQGGNLVPVQTKRAVGKTSRKQAPR